MIILVAHPTKMQKDEDGVYAVPDLYSVSGSADFRNQTHNGFTIHRTFENEEKGVEAATTFYNTKTKFNFQGKIGGQVDFNYSTLNGRYYEKGTEEPLFSLIDDAIPIPMKEDVKVPMMTPEQAFDF
jgi:twinkle protein